MLVENKLLIVVYCLCLFKASANISDESHWQVIMQTMALGRSPETFEIDILP